MMKSKMVGLAGLIVLKEENRRLSAIKKHMKTLENLIVYVNYGHQFDGFTIFQMDEVMEMNSRMILAMRKEVGRRYRG